MDELIQQASMGGYRLQGTILLENFQDKHTTTYDLRKPIRSEKAQYANNDPRKKALKDNANNTKNNTNTNDTNKTNVIKTGNNIVTKSSNNSALSGKSTAGAKSTKTVLENINEDEEDEDQQQQQQGNNTATNNTNNNKIATLRKKWEDDGLMVGDYVRINNHIFSVVKITSKYLVYSFISIILFTAYSHIVLSELIVIDET